MNCITLTLNPAFDHHCTVPAFSLYHEHLAGNNRYEAGGKGVNISRALCANNVPNLAFVVLGNENASRFSAALDADGLCYKHITLPGTVRENLTIHTDNGPETRVSFAGFSADDTLLSTVIDAIDADISSDTIVTFTGRTPGGISMTAIMDFLKKIHDKGARVVIDSKSFVTLDELIAARPWLIKPNQEEISEYLGKEINTLEETLSAACEIHERGVENVMISLGGEGALLVCSEGTFICKPPRIDVQSAIGAGDSSIGGFVAATMAGESASECLCRAVAYGSAACMREGTLPPLPDDVADILTKVSVKKIK